MYVRVKRKKATYFIHIEPSDTVANLKLEIAKLTQQPAEQQRLYSSPEGEKLLEDNTKLADAGVENDQELALTYKLDGSWEEVDVSRFDLMEMAA
ncbi:hypothetical protein WJX73_003284 [Symbiochloris irregularis]|uniref:Ubiquitin-like domain-containing protein n=1 Tax=Symbiochloris irregularis TaxID=706552 RepID=A0AAW1PMT7_9CHLO